MADQRDAKNMTDMMDAEKPQKPTGLRSKAQSIRETSHNVHPMDQPDSIHPPSKPTPRTRNKTPVWFKSSPKDPELMNSEKSSPWLRSATKRLGINKARDKSTETYEDGHLGKQSDPTTQTHQMNDDIPSSTRPNVQVTSRQASNGSPQDKPLPSLPILTVDHKSPIKRSLIDCTEVPLRRSVSPKEGGQIHHEEWPAMQPKIPGDPPHGVQADQSMLKTSLGESLLNGMRNLNIQDRKPAITFGSDVKPGKVNESPNHQQHVMISPVFASNGTNRPLSSSQLPKPRDSMVKSLSRRVEAPAVRQTKTSAIRLRQSIGRRAWTSAEKKKDKTRALDAIEEPRHSSPSSSNHDKHTPHGRTQSRGRYGVTPRGSPYTISSRPLSKKVPAPVPADVVPNGEGYTPDSQVMTSDSGRHEDHSSPSTDANPRKSSIPLPTRLTQSPESGKQQPYSHVASHEEAYPGAAEADEYDRKKYSPDSSPLPPHIVAELPGSELPKQISIAPQRSTDQLTAREMLASSVPEEVSFIDSDSSEGSVHGKDAQGGYRIKRVRNSTKKGLLLRITDSASKVLLGNDEETAVSGSPNDLRRKPGNEDLRESGSPKKPARLSSGFISRPLSIARSITERSLMIVKGDEDEETRHLIAHSDPMRNASDSQLSTSSSGTVRKTARAESPVAPNSLPAYHVDESRVSMESHDTKTSAHGDWPEKDFADFKIPSNTFPSLPEEPSLPSESETPTERPLTSTPKTSRPSTIVIGAQPTREVSPFLFQNLNDEQMSQEKYLNDFVSHSTAGEVTDNAGIKTVFPPRSSSRKHKPPPIIISPPEIFRSNTIQINAAQGARAILADSITKPKNVKSFSQSISPSTARKTDLDGKLHHSPSSSKKVMSNIRGLFHKRSLDSVGTERTNPNLRKISNILVPHNHNFGGMRHVAAASDNAQQALVNNDTFAGDNPALPPAYGEDKIVHKSSHKSTFPTIRNPFASPITPFTAGINSTTTSKAKPSTIQSMTSPGLKSATATISSDPLPTPSLHTATTLTHHLLSMARVEPQLALKETMIDLSKAMVEVVGAARDAEKAVEQARMEAAKAEMAHLRVLREVGGIEGMVAEIIFALESRSTR